MNAIGGAGALGVNYGLASAYDNMSAQNNQFKQTQTTKLKPMTDAERALSESTTGLGLNQADALKRLLSSSFALTPDEMNQLNAIYAPQEANLRRYADILGQDMAGTRGLNRSDTPVSEAVLREVLPAMAQLQSDKMQQGLGLGMQMKNLNLNAAMGMPGASAFNLQKLFNERLATGTTTTTGNTYGTYNPGFLDRFSTAAGAQKDITSAGANLAGGQGGGAMGNLATMWSSDARLKRNITPVSWKWNNENQNEYLGVIAQQVEQSHPHLVRRDKSGHLMVDYGAMVAMLLAEREHLYAQLEKQEQAA